MGKSPVSKLKMAALRGDITTLYVIEKACDSILSEVGPIFILLSIITAVILLTPMTVYRLS